MPDEGAVVDFSRVESNYIKQVLGEPLHHALCAIILYQPSDPIDFLANYLRYWVKHVRTYRRHKIAEQQVDWLLTVQLPWNVSVIAEKAKRLEQEALDLVEAVMEYHASRNSLPYLVSLYPRFFELFRLKCDLLGFRVLTSRIRAAFCKPCKRKPKERGYAFNSALNIFPRMLARRLQLICQTLRKDQLPSGHLPRDARRLPVVQQNTTFVSQFYPRNFDVPVIKREAPVVMRTIRTDLRCDCQVGSLSQSS
ncbi:hypothetical protein CLF_105224 [Clonorchis sinensis]|uniref:Uncharacterized protein n=1 Tax=Clonorchis sinensis TaxID=79923 RepID=G7YD86_CLOSI|nr:hypothetical protein CLF_105224 [Clonorchis sinensis]